MKLKVKIQQVLQCSCTKLLENGRDPETSTVRESKADVDVDDADLRFPLFGFMRHGFKKCLENEEV